MKAFFFFILTLCCASLHAQPDSIISRVIFIGDAGEMDAGQSAVIKHAAGNVLKGKTIVMFLGDNIYPKGIGLPGSAEEAETKAILRSQFTPMRAKGSPVYFIPGNHDWDKSGRQGLAKIKRQGEYLKEQQDSLLALVPPNGCPDPVAIQVSPQLTIIVFDSEWWLFPYNKDNPDGKCSCNSKEEVLERLKVLKAQNKDKFILLASHHPFQTYGAHSGYTSLPVIGGLFQFIKQTFPAAEDTHHRLYKEMIRKISGIFDSDSNVIYVAGHDHGLQFIKSKNIQVVSGAGAKNSAVFKGENSLFADAKPGYVIADLLSNKKLKLTFIIETANGMQEVFTNLIKTHASDKPRSQ
jgi:UDP-2,3-diacylglucosamine pyrophosphatase LpxH